MHESDSSNVMFPVLYEIFFTKNEGFIQIEQVDSEYPDEKEMLLQDGLTFSVLDKKLIQFENADGTATDCYHIQLHYPKIKELYSQQRLSKNWRARGSMLYGD